ncbi:MAG: hypothetical protein ACE1Y4_03040, partial [Lysobacterales bacterium]
MTPATAATDPGCEKSPAIIQSGAALGVTRLKVEQHDNKLVVRVFAGHATCLRGRPCCRRSTLTTRTNSIQQGIQQGAAWGLGHTLTLFLFGGIVLFVTNIMPEEIVRWVELAVGIMLIALGLDVICRLVRDRVHFHTHSHRDGAVHIHAHSHKDEKYQDHCATQHEHKHPTGFPIRALLIGLM